VGPPRRGRRFPHRLRGQAAVTHPPRTTGEILRKRRRISGAMLGREIAAKGRVRLVPGWLFKT
jgi:hypothetical protein